MRVSDPVGGPPNLERFFDEYDAHFRTSTRYEHHLRALVACYSRGDSRQELRRQYAVVVGRVLETDRHIRAQQGGRHLFAHQGRFPELLRDSLVLMAFGLCLRASREDLAAVLSCCDRGDSLLETLAAAAAPGLQVQHVSPRFPLVYGDMYAAISASETERERLIRDYLKVWYAVKMEGFSFKDGHKITLNAVYVGYWCFEAAGIVAALKIDERGFAGDPHYPRDLVSFYRNTP